MARVKVTADEFVEKQARRLKGSIDDIKRGVAKVDKAPGASAAEKGEKWHQKMMAVETREKWERRVASVPLGEWKDKMIKKGLPRVAAGIDEAAPKVRNFAQQLISFQESNLGEIDEMSDLTLEDGVARASAWIRKMGEFNYER